MLSSFCVALALLLPLVARAQAAGEPSVSIRWNAASGPVAEYEVWVSINDQQSYLYTKVSGTQATVSGPDFQVGDALRFEVIAVAADGRRGRPSPDSDYIFFGGVPTPQNVSAVDGTAKNPIVVSWDPIPYVTSYLIFRAQDGGSFGSPQKSTVPSFEDDGTQLGIDYDYTVMALSGRQVSDFSAVVSATRNAVYPKLVASVSSLSVDVNQSAGQATSTFELRNVGDWGLSYAIWSGSSWVQVTPGADSLDSEPATATITVTYALSSLGLGTHDSFIRIYTYYDPPPGETFTLGPPLAIPVHVTVHDTPPTLDVPAVPSIAEGQLVQIPIHASDPDPGSIVRVGMSATAPFASLQDQGGGNAILTLAPGSGSAGLYTVQITAWDQLLPGVVTVKSLSVKVVHVNNPPVIQQVPETTIHVGETSTVIVMAVDPDGNRIAFTTSALPPFASFSDLGNGTGTFTFEPTAADVASYLLVVAAVDDGVPAAFTGMSFKLDVVP